ncbi:hypothetical protein [Actinomycetospora sp. TBRC 11914]|uniref:hypothetical protein n=1 Tax=Actinomycetospora sp. TBRC 11914 TaxID=2729387 RepID=UPI00145F9C0B|nr:hypothetical protein [Actinomycetospora sp. TBRC 11914]NMO92213.1 hypothetical protein [Actinomycetospora sp. TBRC 11914]
MDVRGPHHDPLADGPLTGDDGTAPPPPFADPTAGTARPTDVRLPPVTDAEGVAAWMQADRERGLQLWEPEVRDVPPPRPVPAQRRHRTLPPETVEDAAQVRGAAPEGESAWRRERREEAEFRAQFGEWRADRAGAPSRGVLGGVRLGAPLLVLIAVLIAVVALALHL